MRTPWDALHRAYFNGEAVWAYLTTPFLLAMDGVRVEETEAWREGAETWRVLRAYFPGSMDRRDQLLQQPPPTSFEQRDQATGQGTGSSRHESPCPRVFDGQLRLCGELAQCTSFCRHGLRM
jgi:hypothetical protein